MAVYHAELNLKQEDISYFNKLLELSPDEIYSKYGLKRDEMPCALTAHFSNGYEMDINLIICEEDPPYMDMVLFNESGGEVNCEVAEGNVDDEYHLGYANDDYFVTIKVV